MSAHAIVGRTCAQRLKSVLALEVAQLRRGRTAIGLATVMVENDFGSAAYEHRLRSLSAELDVHFRSHVVPADVQLSALLDIIADLNVAEDVSGILVLRLLPSHIDEATVFRGLQPEMDIKSLHPETGLLALGLPRFVPSTAASVVHLRDTWLESVGEECADFYHRSLIVVGRSKNFGKPAILLGYVRELSSRSTSGRVIRSGSAGTRGVPTSSFSPLARWNWSRQNTSARPRWSSTWASIPQRSRQPGTNGGRRRLHLGRPVCSGHHSSARRPRPCHGRGVAAQHGAGCGAVRWRLRQ